MECTRLTAPERDSPYRPHARMLERSYNGPLERQAFLSAYSDGYWGRGFGEGPLGPRRIHTQFPNAYGAGYWQGFADGGS